ncbi:hypothetical protein [Halorussus marinus]|uniref:hypothetical protein n=1 Tax=Halorussus marinus TaxID=2505976 RepID=UPI001092AFB3|nr:hypothetical protein [Halorussus marinus]
MTDRPRCGNCGRFAGVRYEWRGPSYTEVINCQTCGSKAYRYDAFAAALEDMSDEEVVSGD